MNVGAPREGRQSKQVGRGSPRSGPHHGDRLVHATEVPDIAPHPLEGNDDIPHSVVSWEVGVLCGQKAQGPQSVVYEDHTDVALDEVVRGEEVGGSSSSEP